MEVVWANSRKSLKAARHLGKAVGVSHVVNVSPSAPGVLSKYMSKVDARHHMGQEWVDKEVLMLSC
jgi:hypothetical protein